MRTVHVSRYVTPLREGGSLPAIVEAIARRDADAAEEAMRQHLSEVLSALPKLMKRFPDHFETKGAA